MPKRTLYGSHIKEPYVTHKRDQLTLLLRPATHRIPRGEIQRIIEQVQILMSHSPYKRNSISQRDIDSKLSNMTDSKLSNMTDRVQVLY